MNLMKKISIVSIAATFVLVLLYPAVAQAENAPTVKSGDTQSTTGTLEPIWNATWGGSIIEGFKGVVTDGTSVYTCGYQSAYVQVTDIMIVKYDQSTGSLTWDKSWGTSGDDWGNSIATDGQSLFVAGKTSIPPDLDFYDVLLLKFDKSGNYLWNRTWDSVGGEQGGAIGGRDVGNAVTVMGQDIYVAGFTEARTATGRLYDLLLLKYNQSGSLDWARTMAGGADDIALGLANDGTNVYVTGTTTSYGHGLTDGFMLKYDSSGNELVNVTWGGSDDDYLNGITVDGDYVYLCGRTMSYSASSGTSDAVIVKLKKSDGSEVWNKTAGGPGTEELDGIASDGTYVYSCGLTTSFGKGKNDFYFMKSDQTTGELIIQASWGGSKNDGAYGIATDGTSIYMAGFTESYAIGGLDGMLIKTDINGGVVIPDFTFLLVPMIFAAVLGIACIRRRKIA